MVRKRILIVVGTRPEAIKMAPIVAALRRRSGAVETGLALTGQHTDMVDSVLEAFNLVPDFELGIMKPNQTLYDVARGCLEGLGGILRSWKPNVLLVEGDTATVCFGAMAAFFERILVGHVEAGLRSGDKWAPFPEEIFRQVTDVLADFYFAPTHEARDNLLAEGVASDRIYVTGNTVVDALQEMASRPHEPADSDLRHALESGRRIVLLTAHRRESFGAPIREAFGAIRELADEHEDVEILYPVHPNPHVTAPAREILGDHPRIRLAHPLGYADLVRALQAAVLVLTDSGGIQEEAPTFGAPVLVLREVTERPEGVLAGAARLVGTDRTRILDEARAVLSGEGDGWPSTANPYGDGRAGERIADVLVSSLTGDPRELQDWPSP